MFFRGNDIGNEIKKAENRNDRDIPKIIKFKATTSLRISCLFLYL